MAQKTVILDSSPSIALHEPTNISLNVSPPFTTQSRKRGQPLLGQRQVHYTHFVPMTAGSDHIKELLAIEETDNSESKAIEGRNELLKAEKVVKGEEKSFSSDPPFDSSFEREAKEFMETPQKHNEDTFQVNDDDDDNDSPTGTTAKNDAEIATLIAATQPPKKPTRKPSKPRKKKPAKKIPQKTKKIKKYRIMKKKK